MTKEEILQIVEKQRTYFNSKETFDVKTRISYLKKLKKVIIENSQSIYEALYKDLGKSETESYMCEVGLVLNEISHTLKHIKKYTKKQRVHTPLAQFHASSYKIAVPYGNVLIMSPWNYPFLLSLDPLVEAVAAGNTVLLKTSEFSSNTNIIVKKIINDVFPSEYADVIFGGKEENTTLLNTKFDYIFFTGSKHVGKIVYEQAASQMIPCTLELGGKSPCIVDKSSNLKLAAKRIVFGKFLNCGQTCVAPDFILCSKEIKDKLIEYLINEIKNQFTNDYLNNKSYGKIITKNHFERLLNLIDKNKVIYGGNSNLESLQIDPTIIDNVTFEDSIMNDEIFGPLLPIITYESFEEVIKNLENIPCPLACYLFTNDRKQIDIYNKQFSFGGGCINDTIIHLATTQMGFGGFKESGIGEYHGKSGFNTFSHYKSIVDKKKWIDLPMRYQRYSKFKTTLIKWFLK